MNILLCCIAKNENNYIIEWIEHYLNIGFTKIVIYDNNDDDSLENLLKNYTISNKVIIENFRYKNDKNIHWQSKAYTECYTKYSKEYDWIAFFDCDEFLEFKNKNTTISEFLSNKNLLIMI